MPNLGWNSVIFFVLCDLEIWWITLKNNRAPLLCDLADFADPSEVVVLCDWGISWPALSKARGLLASGNPTLWRGVPVVPIQKSFGSSGQDWKWGKKLLIPCKFCTYRFIRYSPTCYSKVRIDPLMANIRNPDFFASPVVNATWLVVVLPCYLNRDLLSGPKGN